MGRHSHRNKQFIGLKSRMVARLSHGTPWFRGRSVRGDGRLRLGEAGQATVEYAIVVTALLCMVMGLGALLQALQSGLFVEHTVASASHALVTVFGGMADVFSY